MNSFIIETFFNSGSKIDKLADSNEFQKFLSEYDELFNMLEKELTEKQVVILRKMDELSSEMQYEEAQTYFNAGFKLGAKLILDILN